MEKLRAHKPKLQRKYPVSHVGVFGSYARGDATSNSDIDIAVEITEPQYFSVYLKHPFPIRHSPESCQCSSFFVNVKLEKLTDTSLSPDLYFTAVVITTVAVF